MNKKLFFILISFLIKSVIPCTIDFQAVKSVDLLPVVPKVTIKESYHYESEVTQKCYNKSLNTNFAVVRNQVLNNTKYEDTLFAESERKCLLEIKKDKNSISGGGAGCTFFDQNVIIACASEGQWLVFLTKSGWLSKVTIKKNSGVMKANEYFKLFDAQFDSQIALPDEVKALNLNEKNCNLSYDSSRKIFLLSYVTTDEQNHSVKQGQGAFIYERLLGLVFIASFLFLLRTVYLSLSVDLPEFLICQKN